MLTTLLVSTVLLAQPNDLTDATYTSWRDILALKPAETTWLAPKWRLSLWEAMKESRTTKRPILLWTTAGHPLGATTSSGIAMRQTLSDPAIRALVDKFIPAADDTTRLAVGTDVEKVFFRNAFARLSNPSQVESALVAITPEGEGLTIITQTSTDAVRTGLEQALSQFGAVSGDAKAPNAGGGVELPSLSDRNPPKNGLVLRVVVRDLPRPDGRKQTPFNLDFAWFTQDEAASFVPSTLRVDEVTDVPAALAGRLARFHLIDQVMGRTPPFEAGDIQTLRLRTRISTIERGVVTLRIAGMTTCSVATVSSSPTRGVETSILGRARWDTRARKFLTFEIVAIGTRWGGSLTNGREGDTQPQPIGFLLSMATADRADQTPPGYLGLYGWR